MFAFFVIRKQFLSRINWLQKFFYLKMLILEISGTSIMIRCLGVKYRENIVVGQKKINDKVTKGLMIKYICEI